VEEALTALFLDKRHFPELLRDCPELAAALVHYMLDRAREFRSAELNDDRLQSLTKLASGLAVSKQQREQQELLLGELRSVDGKTVHTLQRMDEVSSDVDAVKEEVGEAQLQLERTNSTLGQTVEHLGAMNEQIAGHQESISSLRRLNERNRIAFDLSKSREMLKVGDIQLRLRAADSKRNKDTLEVLADDATVVKREKNLNEPVQFYISGSSQPYEIVITGISKDRVTGYLATPKAKTARG
jgi:hypothetical protein